MRRVLARAGFLIAVVLSVGLYLQWEKFTAGAASAPLPLNGETAATQSIDPPLAQLARLVASDGADGDQFGRSVAVSGDTLVVGAPLDDIGANTSQGSASVYVRSSGIWSFQQKLTANDGGMQDGFGATVAISGDTIVVCAIGELAAYVFVRSGGVWSFQQKLTANDVEPPDFFGSAVALSGDTIVISSPEDNIGTNIDQGSAYVFIRSGTVWSQPFKLIDNDGKEGELFGAAVGVSNDTIVVGALLDNIGANIGQGSAYVYARSGAVWTFQQKLTAGDGAADDEFGGAVAISGDTILVGAIGDKIGTNASQGSAYVFVRSGVSWSQQQKLTAGDGAANDLFGQTVAIHGNTALVGATLADIGAAKDQGAAYLFSRSGAAWTQRQKLTAQESVTGDAFGSAVALGDDAVVVGVSNADIGAKANQGAVYFFGCGYVEQQKLSNGGGGANNSFGAAVAIDGDTAVVSAPYYDVGTASDRGSAFVYVRNGAAWTQAAQLFANDGAAGDLFGYSVSISGDYIVIGAIQKSINGNANQGAAYVFVRSGGTWTQQARLLAGDGAAGDLFGYSVSISGDRVAVGAPLDDVGGKQDQGSVYIFARSGSSWTTGPTLRANDSAAADHFGWSVALAGAALISGAPGVDIGANGDQGAAYVFESSGSSWSQLPRLTADDGAVGDFFGYSVAVFGQTALAGAPFKRFGSGFLRGGGYIFVKPSASASNWLLVKKLTLDADGSDELGFSVALSANTAALGTPERTISGRTGQGAAFVFTRIGQNWFPYQSSVASDGTAAAHFGYSAAISGDTILVGAKSEGSGQPGMGEAYVFKNNCGPPLGAFTSVSAASFAPATGLAPESIAAGFGSSLGSQTVAAPSTPLPTTLGGLSLKLTDSNGVERLSPLFYVSPGQINYLIPPGAANGPAAVTVTNGGVPIASGAAEISTVAPALFSVGQGAAGFALRVSANGAQSYEPIVQFDSSQNCYVPAPIDLGPATDQVFLALYGTGVRFRSSLSAVSCSIGGVSSEVVFAGASPDYVGLDQINVRLSRALIGRGAVDVALSVDGKPANTVRINIR